MECNSRRGMCVYWGNYMSYALTAAKQTSQKFSILWRGCDMMRKYDHF